MGIIMPPFSASQCCMENEIRATQSASVHGPHLTYNQQSQPRPTWGRVQESVNNILQGDSSACEILRTELSVLGF